MHLQFPQLKHEKDAKAFISELKEFNSEINGDGKLSEYLDKYSYEEWIEKINQDSDLAKVTKDRIPSYTYFYMNRRKYIVGIITIRTALNKFHLNENGHIGYSVRPTERKKGYATKMLKAALKQSKKLGMERVLLICDKINKGSAKVIKRCGGKFAGEKYSKYFDEVVEKYWIVL